MSTDYEDWCVRVEATLNPYAHHPRPLTDQQRKNMTAKIDEYEAATKAAPVPK